MTKRIGLLGMFGSANLGDTAIQSAVMTELTRRCPDLEFVGISHDSYDVAATFGIPGFSARGKGHLVFPGDAPAERPNGRAGRLSSLRNIYRQAGALDVLLISGGGQLDDFWGGVLGQPFRLFAWCASCATQNRPVYAVAVGVDDLRSRFSHRLVSSALSFSELQMFRDEGSLRMIRGERKRSLQASVVPDPAFTLVPPTDSEAGENGSSILISPISMGAFGLVSRRDYETYLVKLAELGDSLIADGFDVVFACSQTRMDVETTRDVVSGMKHRKEVVLEEVANYEEFLEIARRAKVSIVSRLHGLIFSTVANCPAVAVAPARKVCQQMSDLDLEDYCIAMSADSIQKLPSVVYRAIENEGELKARLRRKTEELRVRVGCAFDELAERVSSG